MTNVLVVDDLPSDLHLVGRLLEQAGDLKVEYAVHGADALAKMQQSLPDVVVTDLVMPQMDGLELVRVVTQRYPLVPVILMTAQGNEEIAVAALQWGAASYVPKRRLADNLLETVHEVLRLSYHKRHETQLMGCMTKHECSFVLDNDPELIGPLATHLQEEAARIGLCDDVEGTRLGVALEEALKNALYHGTLELGDQLREKDREACDALVAERRGQAPYRDRHIYVEAEISATGATFVIRDDGPGFDVSSLPDPSDPASLAATTGKGMLLMRSFMDEVSYNQAGNVVTLIKRPYVRDPSEKEREFPMSPPRIFDAKNEGNTLVVASRSDAGSLVGEEMAYELTGLLERFESSDLQNVVIDLEGSPYFGTSMLQVMTAMWKRVRARGGKMALCRVSPTGREILHVTRFDTLWPICPGQNEALQTVSQP
jgi:anti-anti-sigma factor